MAYWLPWAKVLVCGDYLSPVEIPMLSPGGSVEVYRATLQRLGPLAAQAEWVVPGHGAPYAATRALEILAEDDAYLAALQRRSRRRHAPGGSGDAAAARGARRQRGVRHRSRLRRRLGAKARSGAGATRTPR